jgi:hypothetical protein
VKRFGSAKPLRASVRVTPLSSSNLPLAGESKVVDLELDADGTVVPTMQRFAMHTSVPAKGVCIEFLTYACETGSRPANAETLRGGTGATFVDQAGQIFSAVRGMSAGDGIEPHLQFLAASK